MDSNIIKIELEKFLDVFIKYGLLLTNAKDKEEMACIMIDVYQYVKVISSKFYNEEEGEFQNLSTIINHILLLETYLEDQFIIDVKPDFDYNNFSSHLPKVYDEEMLLKYIITKARKMLVCYFNRLDMENPLECDLTGSCAPISKFIESECKDLGIPSKWYEICPGFSKTAKLHNDSDKHCFNIIYFKGKKYLVDVTYSQFFLLSNTLLDRIGIPLFNGCRAGRFMVMDEDRKKVAEKLLRDGWIELRPNVLKNYLDGFAISYRNGHYYEETNDFSYKTNYTDLDYENFLNEVDNQLNYESEFGLEMQKKPLKNPYLKFI